MMLWYKAWRETRTRFLLSAFALAGFCLLVVLFQSRLREWLGILPPWRGQTYNQHIYAAIFSGTAKSIFVLLLPFLGLGGLLRERARGSAAFTLALPLSRTRLVGTHAAVGLAQVAVLAFLPALLVPALSPLVGQSYPFAQALCFGTLWFCGGILIFALAVFFSALLSGEYTAPVACFALLFLEAGANAWPPLQPYHTNLLRNMGGLDWVYLDAQQNAVLTSLPWARLALLAVLALGLLLASVAVTRRQDF
jgi:ABC-type transport system involved in multi-copper enzyme maturation permease subunit